MCIDIRNTDQSVQFSEIQKNCTDIGVYKRHRYQKYTKKFTDIRCLEKKYTDTRCLEKKYTDIRNIGKKYTDITNIEKSTKITELLKKSTQRLETRSALASALYALFNICTSDFGCV